METYDKDLQSIQEARWILRKAKEAEAVLATYDEVQIDKILQNMVHVAQENDLRLAEMAVEETGFGKVADKAFKNRFASVTLYDAMKSLKTIGVINEDKVNKVTEIAVPIGVLLGIVPSTNPTSTIIYKAMIAIKSRNTIVFSPHPSALKCGCETARLMSEAAVAAGAPEGAIAILTNPSIAATNEMLKADEVNLIIATGGSAMVKAAYSSGKPALGVGPGNSPCYIEKTADAAKAVAKIMASKTFDYGTICASEQSVITEECNRAQVIEEFKKQGGYFMTTEETDKVCRLLFAKGHAMNAKFVGRTPQAIAEAAGIQIPVGTRVLLGEQHGVGDGYPLSYEKLTTVLAFYTVKDWHEACDLSITLLHNCGAGHTLSIHTENPEMAMKFSAKPVNRILVNASGSQAGVGASSGLFPSFTLGCGSQGGSATSDNVSPLHLINIKRVAYGIKEVEALPQVVPASPSTVGGNGGLSVDDQLLSVVEEVISLLKQRGA